MDLSQNKLLGKQVAMLSSHKEMIRKHQKFQISILEAWQLRLIQHNLQ